MNGSTAGASPAQAFATRLIGALEREGIAVLGVSRATPSLEDVFLDVVERTEAKAQQGGQAGEDAGRHEVLMKVQGRARHAVPKVIAKHLAALPRADAMPSAQAVDAPVEPARDRAKSEHLGHRLKIDILDAHVAGQG